MTLHIHVDPSHGPSISSVMWSSSILCPISLLILMSKYWSSERRHVRTYIINWPRSLWTQSFLIAYSIYTLPELNPRCFLRFFFFFFADFFHSGVWVHREWRLHQHREWETILRLQQEQRCLQLRDHHRPHRLLGMPLLLCLGHKVPTDQQYQR